MVVCTTGYAYLKGAGHNEHGTYSLYKLTHMGDVRRLDDFITEDAAGLGVRMLAG